jgi:uncharacterized membrane protein
MQISPLHYLPLSLPFFSALVGVVAVLWALLEIGAFGYAYTRLGLNPRTALLVLLVSLIGSYINIPVAELPEQQISAGRLVDYFGIQYVVPVVVSWPGTIIAVNVGGAVIPVVVSALLLVRYRLWVQGPLAVICVAVVSHLLARPIYGLGIAVPIFVPALATAVTALLLSRRHAPRLAYIAGSCGTLLGADLLNLGKLQGLGAPVASIGGAGTFDGIFLTGVLAVLIAGLTRGPEGRINEVPPLVSGDRIG